jgi:hypothetical protein
MAVGYALLEGISIVATTQCRIFAAHGSKILGWLYFFFASPNKYRSPIVELRFGPKRLINYLFREASLLFIMF